MIVKLILSFEDEDHWQERFDLLMLRFQESYGFYKPYINEFVAMVDSDSKTSANVLKRGEVYIDAFSLMNTILRNIALNADYTMNNPDEIKVISLPSVIERVVRGAILKAINKSIKGAKKDNESSKDSISDPGRDEAPDISNPK